MVNRPTYSLRGARIDFNELRMQSRRSDADRRKPYDATEDTLETQELVGGFTPAPTPAVEDTPPKAVPKATPKVEVKTESAPAPKPASPLVDKSAPEGENVADAAKDDK